MIDHVSLSPAAAQENQTVENKRVLQMVRNDRMGGYVPSWETAPASAQDKIERALTAAQGASSDSAPSFTAALAYQNAQNTAAAPRENAAFGFGDLVDIINPLQHIPVLSQAYRAMTGDEIKPAGRIIGGALFGGALGAAASLVNVVIEEETGKDVAGNAYAMVMKGEPPRFKNAPPQDILSKAARLAGAPAPVTGEDLPASLLAFTPAPYETAQSARSRHAHAAQSRYNS